MTAGNWRAVIAPEFWIDANARFDRISNKGYVYYVTPPFPESRYGNGFANPWYASQYSADLPWRFGKCSMGG